MSANNFFQYPNWITQKSLRRLLNKLVVAEYGNYDYNKEFTRSFPIGETLRVRFPQRYYVTDGLGYNPQALENRSTDVTCNQIFGIHFDYNDLQRALEMGRTEKEIEEQYLDPAMDQLAQEIDSRFTRFAMLNTPNIVGALGTDPTTLDSVSGAAREKLIQYAGFYKEKGMIVTPAVERAMIAAGVSYFNPTSEISKQYKDGLIGTQGGFMWNNSMSLYSHTAGTLTTPTVSGSGQSGSVITIACTAGDTLNQGDIIAFGCLPVNPSTRRSFGSSSSVTSEKTFVVTATTVAAGATMDVPIYPDIIGPGSQYQNVDALPVTGATVTLFPGTNSPNGKSGMNSLALAGDSFAIVGVQLETPENEQIAQQTRDPKTGIQIRFVRAWDPIQSRMVNRFDCVLGFGRLYADNCAVRVLSLN